MGEPIRTYTTTIATERLELNVLAVPGKFLREFETDNDGFRVTDQLGTQFTSHRTVRDPNEFAEFLRRMLEWTARSDNTFHDASIDLLTGVPGFSARMQEGVLSRERRDERERDRKADDAAIEQLLQIVMHSDVIATEKSPVAGTSLAAIIKGAAASGGASAVLALLSTSTSPVAILYFAGGVVLCYAAVGIGEGLRHSLKSVIETKVTAALLRRDNEKRRRTRRKRDQSADVNASREKADDER